MKFNVFQGRGKRAGHSKDNKIDRMLRDGLLAPLVEGDENSSTSASSQSSGLATRHTRQSPLERLKTVAVGILLAGGTVASIGSMVFAAAAFTGAPAIAVFVMGAVFVAHVPYSAYKEVRIVKLPALRRLNVELREEVNLLERETAALAEEVRDLQPEAERATVVEKELRALAAQQGVDYVKAVETVKENDLIISEMKDNLRQRIVQDVIKIVLSSDKDKTGRFSEAEKKILVFKIHLQLQGYGVDIDEEKFYKVMNKGSDPSISQTIQIVKNLIPAIDRDEDNDITKEDGGDRDAYDMFRVTNDTLSNSLAGGPSLSIAVQRRPSQSSRRSSGPGLKHPSLRDKPRPSQGLSPPEPKKRTSKITTLFRNIRDSESIDEALDNIVESFEGRRARLNTPLDTRVGEALDNITESFEERRAQLNTRLDTRVGEALDNITESFEERRAQLNTRLDKRFGRSS